MLDIDEIKAGKVVLESEDGDKWWIVGHIDRDTAVEAVKVWITEVTPDEVGEWDFPRFTISHGWWYDDGTGNDDSYHRCEHDHPGAEPFTQVDG